MKILAVDVGTGTQDIFLYDSRIDIENGFKLIVPSPTMIVRRRIQQATEMQRPVLLTGVTMGGGPGAWAAEDHVRAGYALFATPEAAQTLNDDLDAVRETGVQVISEDEAKQLPDSVVHIRLADFDFESIRRAFAAFDVSLDDLAAIAVAAFDHGAAPPDISDRQFRFDYLDERIRSQNRLTAFAYRAEDIPPIMTRLRAVGRSAAQLPAPLVVMDTAPAAVLGARYDPLVAQREQVMIANVGNFHTLAFRLSAGGIDGVFEHHTGFLNLSKLEDLLTALANSSLRHEDVFDDMGHGALVYAHRPLPLDRKDFNVVVTGPRRAMMKPSSLRPYFAVPFGDMMVSGCFGLLVAVAEHLPELAGPIRSSLSGRGGAGTPPWEIRA